ncbi:CRISPR-associated endonuclease Cas2 [Pasteurellaceae bacterium LFhippo2]|nr:CRISPR-associated endonuclease Cas2 [Pasteurellaceae bacterium LFhippo2]
MAIQRKRYLVAYDIIDSKRRYHVHKRVNSYAVTGQKSFYECWLTVSELAEFKQKILTIMDEKEDRLFIFQIQHNTQPILFGIAKVPTTQLFLVV